MENDDTIIQEGRDPDDDEENDDETGKQQDEGHPKHHQHRRQYTCNNHNKNDIFRNETRSSFDDRNLESMMIINRC